MPVVSSLVLVAVPLCYCSGVDLSEMDIGNLSEKDGELL